MKTTSTCAYSAVTRSQNPLGDQTADRDSALNERSFFRELMGWAAGMLVILGVIICGGCATRTEETLPKEWLAQTPGTLAAGDVVKLSFAGTPELNQSQKIRADGMITVPLLGELHAAGKRPGQFQGELVGRYKSQLKNNEVTVALESSAIPVYVSGAVLTPGKVVLDRPMTVFEAIIEAGGFNPASADYSKVSLIRIVNGQHMTRILDLRPTLKGKPSAVFYVKGYDVIQVPRRWSAQE